LADTAEDVAIAPEDVLRADMYDFMSGLLAAPADATRISQCASLTGDDTDLGRAITALARVARAAKPAGVTREFNALFIGVGRGELVPYGSYYMTGFLNEKPLAVLRNEMARLRIERAPNVFEPEDNIASLCEMMSGLIRGRFGAAASKAQRGQCSTPPSARSGVCLWISKKKHSEWWATSPTGRSKEEDQ